MKQTLLALLLALASPLLLAAGDHSHAAHGAGYSFGEPGKPAAVTRTIRVRAGDDMKFVFDPPLSSIRRGETIRFEIRNTGKLPHEFSIGDSASQKAHAKMMQDMPDMQHEADATAVSLPPGQSASLIWTFSKAVPGGIVFGCQVPGHFAAGMQATVPVN